MPITPIESFGIGIILLFATALLFKLAQAAGKLSEEAQFRKWKINN
jgi:hypothetical protein